jgi:hypothetical protein
MSDIISWDKAIDKKVKSTDNKDLGKVQSITRDYIQTKEGMVGKNYYYIPKYYMQGYDGDNLWVSLTKDEVKSRFEGEKGPPASTFETPEYTERRRTIRGHYPDFENNIPAYAAPVSTGTAAASTTVAAAGTRDSIAMAWDKIIDRKVKSTDNQELGKVESVSSEYVEVKEGALHKRRYYIPKYYVEGYDGENVRTSLTKNEIKDKYERDSPPSPSEFQTDLYVEQKRKVEANYPQFLHGIPWMAREPGVQLRTERSGQILDIPWEEVIHKRVKTTDDVDMGDIERVGNDFIVVREGVGNVRLYYIPKAYINNYDGSSIYVAAPSGLVSAKFERETEPTPEEIRLLSEDKPRSETSGNV